MSMAGEFAQAGIGNHQKPRMALFNMPGGLLNDAVVMERARAAFILGLRHPEQQDALNVQLCNLVQLIIQHIQ
ncbi:hypothetical protein D3C75_954830 [compost metagenome]